MKKILNILAILVAVLGGLVILGAAGASDVGTITTGQALVRVASGAMLLVGSWAFANIATKL